MNRSTVAPPSTSRSIDPDMVEGMRTLRTGLELTRASQLTMLRFQLALQKSNRRAAMQALDHLLDIDAEMGKLAATQGDAPSLPAGDAALSRFIGLQKTAIAAEKHALAGGDLRRDGACANWTDSAALPAPAPLPDDVRSEDPAGRGGWAALLAVAIVAIIFGIGAVAYL